MCLCVCVTTAPSGEHYFNIKQCPNLPVVCPECGRQVYVNSLAATCIEACFQLINTFGSTCFLLFFQGPLHPIVQTDQKW